VTQPKDNKHRREAELLGMPYGVAEKTLRLAVMHELAKQLGKDVCCHCGLRIETPSDFALSHLQSWQDAPAKFWDLTNVTFSHASCEASRGQGGEKTMRRVVIKIEDENGNQLPGVKHKGSIHIAASDGERYRIRVKNTTGKRALVVITVDGRNIIDGQPGAIDGNGYVLAPYEEHAFDGWRQTDQTVAAFRFGKKGESYSSQMGSPENVGIIGVAVFDEKAPPKPTLTVRERIVPMPYPVYPVTPWDPWDPWRSRPFWTLGDVQVTGIGGQGFSLGTSTAFGLETSKGLSCSVSSAVSSETTVDMNVQQLGTDYGETLASVVGRTTFTRATDHPAEVHEVRYDSLASLQAQGIMSEPPSRRPKAPSAFPVSPKVTPGYCPAPPKQR
jgi:hypothetical protein